MAKCAKQDVGKNSVVAFRAVILFFEQMGDGMLEVAFDNFVAFGKISLDELIVFPPEKVGKWFSQPFYQKGFGFVNINSLRIKPFYELLKIVGRIGGIFVNVPLVANMEGC